MRRGNRLITVIPRFPTTSSKKLLHSYDFMNRRVRKVAYAWTGSAWNTLPALDRQFIYDGWNLLEEIAGVSGVVAKYTWALDLSGQNGNPHGGTGVSPAGLHAAGGIGGLLAAQFGNFTFTNDLYFYDANGNVCQLVRSNTGTNDAKYE